MQSMSSSVRGQDDTTRVGVLSLRHLECLYWVSWVRPTTTSLAEAQRCRAS